MNLQIKFHFWNVKLHKISDLQLRGIFRGISPLSISRTFRTLFLAKLFYTCQISSGKPYILRELKMVCEENKTTWGRTLLGIWRHEQVATPISTLQVSHQLAWPTLPMECTLLDTRWDDPAIPNCNNAWGVTIFLRQHWAGIWPHGSRPGSGISTQMAGTAFIPGPEPCQGCAAGSAHWISPATVPAELSCIPSLPLGSTQVLHLISSIHPG